MWRAALLLGSTLALSACGAPAPAAPREPASTTPPPAPPAPTPVSTEKPAAARWGKTRVRFADAEEARALLGSADDFTAAMSELDRRARLGSKSPVDEATFLAHAAAQARGWPATTWERWQKAMRRIGKALEELDVPMPDEILFIATTGREELGKPYTRANAIVIPEKVALNLADPFGLIAHELFHVVTRHAPERRDALYGILGFERVGDVAPPAAFESRRLTNPDAYHNQHAIEVSVGEAELLVVPLIRTKEGTTEVTGDKLLGAIELYLLQVEASGEPVLDDAGAPSILAVPSTDYHAKAAVNTGYAIHPEEVLADNFALLLKRRNGEGEAVARPDVLDALEAVLK